MEEDQGLDDVTPTGDQLAVELVACVLDEDKLTPLASIYERFFAGDARGYSTFVMACMYVHSVTFPKGNLHRSREELSEIAEDLGITDHQVPGPGTIPAHLLHPLPPLDEEDGLGLRQPLDYDRFALYAWFDDVSLAQFQAAVELFDVQDHDFYVTIDGSPTPFYGRTPPFGSGEERWEFFDPANLSIAGSWTLAAFKKGGGGTQPEFHGTKGKHLWLHVTIHFWDNGVSIPLMMRWFHRSRLGEHMDEVAAVLGKLGKDPLAILMDKEFINGDALEPLRRFADFRGTWVVGPRSQGRLVKDFLKEGWSDEAAIPVYGLGEPVWRHSRRETWRSDDAKGYAPYELVGLYALRGDVDEVDAQDSGLLGLGSDAYGVCFYSSRHVTEQEAKWFAELYRNRWACENLFKRYKANCGRSQARGMFQRHLQYGFAMIAFGQYGLWRWHRQVDRELPNLHPELALSRYFAGLRALACRVLGVS